MVNSIYNGYRMEDGAVRGVVGIEGGVVSGC